jgi:DNA polymerase-3 subunit gamma/tau
MRDAESIFDQVIAYGRGEVTLDVVNSILGVTDAELLASVGDAVADSDIVGVFQLVDEIVTSGKDIDQLLEDLSLYFRDLLRISLGAPPSSWMQASSDSGDRMQAQAAALGPTRIGEIIEELGEATARVRDTAQKPLLLEVTLAHLASIPAEGALAEPANLKKTEEKTDEPEQKAEKTQTQAAAPRAQEEPPQPAPAEAASEPEVEAEPGAAREANSAPETEAVDMSDGPLTLDAVTEYWPRVIDALSSGGHPAVAAIVSDAAPCAVEGSAITLAFGTGRQFEYDRANRDYADTIAEAAGAVFGREVELSFRLQEQSAPTEKSSEGAQAGPSHSSEEPADADATRQQETVLRLLDEFDGTEHSPG